MLNRLILVPFAAAALLGLAACNSGHPGQVQGVAPGIANGDSGYGPMRNLSDPNAPFAVLAASPHLEKRPALLDVNAVPVCDPSNLHVWESGANVNGNHRTIRYTLSNSGDACRLTGFPAITLLAPGGRVLGSVRLQKVSEETIAATLTNAGGIVPADSSASYPSEPVLLVPKGRAGFDIGWTSGPACQQVSQIVIAAPGSDHSVIIPRQLTVCAERLLVSAVSPAE